jgi:hypothetical protein
MIKQFSAGDITVRPFSTFKNWTVQSIDSSSVDKYGYDTYYNNKVSVDVGLHLTSSFFLSGSEFYVASNEPINPSGKYSRIVYNVTDAMFYRNASDPFQCFGVEYYTEDPKTGRREIREINDRIIAARLKHNVYGDKIIPNTFHLTDNSNVHQTLEIYDDGYTNLYVTGSHFPSLEQLGAVREKLATPYWVTSSGEFYVYFRNGVTQSVDYINAKQYMAMGQDVRYVAPEESDWAWDTSSYQDIFQADNEHFGESVSSWGPYIAVGSSMDDYSLADYRLGYAAIFKIDPSINQHRLIKKINFPFTQSSDGSVLFEDSFGYSVALRDDFLAVGSPVGSACSSSAYPGYVCVYDKDKGGIDHWGKINLLKGKSDGDRFGNSVSIDNDILVVGAPAVSGSKGAAYVFRKKKYMDSGDLCQSIPTGSVWEEVVTVEDFCKELTTGSYIASQSYVPTFVSGNYAWVHEATITSSLSATGDNFGWSVSVDSDKLLVGTNKTGNGYAALFTCSYHSASLSSCPTASWSQVQLFVRNTSYGDLDMNLPEYSVDVTSTQISTDSFGKTVSVSGNSLVIGCQYDKAFVPYSGFGGDPLYLGAAYFYNYIYDTDCEEYRYDLKTKSFGDRTYFTNNNFAKAVSMDGFTAVVTSLSDIQGRSVDYTTGDYILENYGYESTGSNDSVLGRATIYNFDQSSNTWKITGELRRNKESNYPYNLYGYSVSLSSDFLAVGAPIVNIATASAYADIINESTQSLYMPSTYSGSVYVYDMTKYKSNPLIGNVFYKNGYAVITNTGSNYENIMLGTGSRGFQMNYQGSHTIYEHEYLISVRPGEFNYSTNPSALVQSPLLFDVNQDGKVDANDADLIMRYLNYKKFYNEYTVEDYGIWLEQSTLRDYSWWAQDILQTESEDVLLKEMDYAGYNPTSSLDSFTKSVFDYIEEKLVATNILDINGDGVIDTNDGYIFALYVLNRLYPENLSPYITKNSTRIYVVDIQKYLNQYCGFDQFKVSPEFFGYQYSSSYDPTGSYLAPYITTIGLYDNNELVAVGKLGRPIKNLIDWPVNIVVRFDT